MVSKMKQLECDFSVIVLELEIQRLQTSLHYLRETQKQLNEEIQKEPAPVLTEAFKENEEVMYVDIDCLSR